MTVNHDHAHDAAHDARRLVAVNPDGTPATIPAELAAHVDGLAGRFVDRLRDGVLAASVTMGLELLDELMAAEVTELAGPRGEHDAGRTHKRPGCEDGSVVLGGRKIEVRRPRVRTADETAEAALETYATARARDLLACHTVGAMLAGLSTRRYPAALEPVGDQPATGTSKSSVSRQFVHATAERLAELMGCRLDDRRWLIVYVDGFTFGDH